MPPPGQDQRDDAIPADPSAYAAYVAAVVGRYGPHGSFWDQHPSLADYAIQTYELWNEPYYDNGDNGDYDPGAYARLVKAAAIAGRQADPSAHFLLAAENQAQLVNSNLGVVGRRAVSGRPRPEQLLRRGRRSPLRHQHDRPERTPPRTRVQRLRADPPRPIDPPGVRRSTTPAGKPLWITEIGWPTCTSGSDRCTTPAGQAADLTTVFNYARTSGRASSRLSSSTATTTPTRKIPPTPKATTAWPTTTALPSLPSASIPSQRGHLGTRPSVSSV